ncbi:hypothetical protein QOT17_013463 [Balamuthia mandrillaris]
MALSGKLAKLSLDDVEPLQVLKNLKQDALNILYQAETCEEVALDAASALNSVMCFVEQAAIKCFVGSLNKELLARAVAPLNIDHKAAGNNPNSKNVLSKRLSEKMNEEGMLTFLATHPSVEDLKIFSEFVEAPSSGSAKKEKIAAALTDHFMSLGLVAHLQTYPLQTLQLVCQAAKLDDQEQPVGASKPVLIDAILSGKAIKKTSKKGAAPKFSKTKKPIKKGITYQDIYQHYYRPELVEYCKENGLLCSGSSKQLINRILAWLDGDKENTTPKAQNVEKAPEPAATKAKPKATKSKVLPVVKEEPEEEEEAHEVEEQEVEEVEEEDENKLILDLSKLKSYKIADLQQYCEEHGIQVNGKTKQSLVNAILAHED